jgi:hypothetical protein
MRGIVMSILRVRHVGMLVEELVADNYNIFSMSMFCAVRQLPGNRGVFVLWGALKVVSPCTVVMTFQQSRFGWG